MASDKLFEMAFKYKKTKIWNKLFDNIIFAVKLPGGVTGYISISGFTGENYGLSLYIGDRGFDSFKTLVNMDTMEELDKDSPLLRQELILQQDCLKCLFQNKDELTEPEYEQVKSYTRRNGINLRGRYAFPQFIKYSPGFCPWFIQSGQDEEYLARALEAAVEMGDILKTKKFQDIGLKNINGYTDTIPLMELKEGKFHIGSTPVPKPVPELYIVPEVYNELNVAKLKNVKKNSIWQCELVQFPEPVQDSPEEVPVFPMIFLAVESNSGFVLPAMPFEDYNKNPGGMLDGVVDAFLQQKACPAAIQARDERTYYFLEGFCRKLKIKLEIVRILPLMDEIEENFMEFLEKDDDEELLDIMDVVGRILELGDNDLSKLPGHVKEQLKTMLDNHLLPDIISNLFEEVLGTGHQGGEKNNQVVNKNNNVISINSGKSFIISVSCGTGCYRHIQISAGSTLFGLHKAILDAFGFYDDHAHAFFMDNVIWSDDAYYADMMEDDGRTTSGYTLIEAGVETGKKFKYLFDFGDEWVFQCKTLRIIDDETDVPMVIKKKGESPEQYGDWE